MKVVFLILLLFITRPAAAQLAAVDTLPWQVRAGLQGNLITGNVQRILFNGRMELRHQEANWGLFSGHTYYRGWIAGRSTENDFFSRNFLYLYPKRRWYPYAMAWFNTDLRRRIDQRWQLGLGVSLNLWEKIHHLLKISATGTWEETVYAGTGFHNFDESRSTYWRTWRATLRLYGRETLTKSGLQWQYEGWGQWALDGPAFPRFFLESKLSLPVTKHLAMSTALQYSHETLRLTGVRPDDVIWTFGINFN